MTTLNFIELEKVTGGEVDEREIFHLDMLILVYRMGGHTLDEVLAVMREAGYSQDAMDYVAAKW
jgi:hypothetical protein